MEQQNGAPGAASAQAARTVLPGEPFDSPQPPQVPGPRPGQHMQPPGAPVAQWNHDNVQPGYGSSGYPPVPDMALQFPDQTAGYPTGPVNPINGVGDFAALHEYASLPVAQPFDAPTAPTAPPQGFPASAYPPPAPESTWPPSEPLPPQGFGAPQQYPPPHFPSQAAPLPPFPPGLPADEQPNDGTHRRTARKSVDKRVLALVGIVVIAAGGYFAYHLLSKSDTATPVPVPVTAAPVTRVVAYNFPSNVAGFTLQTVAKSAPLRAASLAELKTWSPTAAKTMRFGSYSPGHPHVVALTFRPGAAKVAADYTSFAAFVARPDKGNVAVQVHSASPGAAGGQMRCGGQRGPNAQSWCVWHNKTTIGLTVIEGSPKSAITEIVTREMRAYAEH